MRRQTSQSSDVAIEKALDRVARNKNCGGNDNIERLVEVWKIWINACANVKYPYKWISASRDFSTRVSKLLSRKVARRRDRAFYQRAN